MSNYIDESSYTDGNELGDKIKIYKNCRVVNSKLDDNSVVGDSSVVFNSIIGKYTQLNRNSMVRESTIGDYSYGGMQFTAVNCVIGKYTSISWNVSIGGANHDYSKVTTHAFLYNPNFGFLNEKKELYNRFTDNCIIGNDIWIGAGAQVLRGVSVGDGSVIAAGAIVTKDVPPYSIVAGIPARVIKNRFEKKIVDRLLQIKWWEFPPDVIKDSIYLFNSSPTEELLSKLEKLKKEYDCLEN